MWQSGTASSCEMLSESSRLARSHIIRQLLWLATSLAAAWSSRRRALYAVNTHRPSTPLTHTDRHTHRHTYRHTDRQTDRQTNSGVEQQTTSLVRREYTPTQHTTDTHRQTYRHIDTQTDRHTHRQTSFKTFVDWLIESRFYISPNTKQVI